MSKLTVFCVNVFSADSDAQEGQGANQKDDTINVPEGFSQLTDRQRKIYDKIKNGTVNGTVNVPINVPINGKVLKAIERSPGINRRRLAQELQVDVRTIGRALSALSGQVEHRGSKKTGGYYLVALKAKEGQS